MKLHELRPAKGATHKVKRIGRGDGSGHGGTSTKGTKGAQARTGYKRKMGHEGGQMPIQRRIPKRGLLILTVLKYTVLNLGQIEQLAEKYNFTGNYSRDPLYQRADRQNDRVKILGNGELKSKFTFKVNAVVKRLNQPIEAAGGSIEIVK
jgi:large subunit ribosomal protein L15